MSLASDKEASAVFRDQTALTLELLKDLQQSRVPDFLKAAKNFQVTLSAFREATMRLQLAWEHLAGGVGAENNFGSRIKEMGKQFSEITEIDAEWDDGWDRRFVQPVNMALIANEGKRTTVKEGEIKKVAARFDKEAKSAESNAKKKMKKGDKQAATEEYNQVLASIEARRKLVVADLNAHCEQSYFILLQAFCLTMKEKMDTYERMHVKSTALLAYVGESQKVQPDMAAAPSNETMRDIYDEKRAAAALTSTLRKGSAAAGDMPPPSPKQQPGSTGSSYGISVPPPSAPSKKPSVYGLMKVQATWAFNAEREGELSMQPGDILIIHDNTGSWWKAELNGNTGNIPANYVVPYEDSNNTSAGGDEPLAPLPHDLENLPPPTTEVDNLPPPAVDPTPDPVILPPPISAGPTPVGRGAGGRGSGMVAGRGRGADPAATSGGSGVAGGPGPGGVGRGRGSVPSINLAAGGRGRGGAGPEALVSPGGRGGSAPLSATGRGGAASAMSGSAVDLRSAGGRGAGGAGGGGGGAGGGSGFNGAASTGGFFAAGAASGGRGNGTQRGSAGRGRGMPEALEPPPALDLPPPIIDDAPAPLPRDDPLPPAPTAEWQQYTTPEGNVYYYNAATGESKWTME
eukprot:TRINITY_DN677_c0_g1_i1.p1 TRINITY_DN677_c0_g1~~TRINITY_DN677_c0_g1_i1.p1  ORF type:complete len:630 (-),score=147.64 TRINITY_DN677_c0_g1_i1:74-1963(-)